MSFIVKQAVLAATFTLTVGAAFASTTLTATITDATPIIADSSYAAFWFEEISTPTGGAYTLHNNTTNLTLIGFGVTNPDSDAVAMIDDSGNMGYISISNTQGGYWMPNIYTADFWEAFNLSNANWADDRLWADYYGAQVAAQALYGDIADALGEDGYANYYQILDASGIYPQESAWGFTFANAPMASSLFGVAIDENFNTFAFVTAPQGLPSVPLPAGMPLLLTGLGAFGLIRRKRQGSVSTEAPVL